MDGDDMADGYDYRRVHLRPGDEYAQFKVTTMFGSQATVNGRTIAMLDQADSRLGFDLAIEQGSYTTAVSASGGTHAGGGVIDIETNNLSDEQIQQAVLVLRQTGFAAWYRHTGDFANVKHIHAVSIGDTDLSAQAEQQVLSYKAGGNGLDGGVDDGPSVHVPPFDYSAALQDLASTSGTGPGLGDSFAPDPGSPISQTNDDGDGLTDEFEKLLGTDPTKADTDHDGLSDVQETYQFHTDPLTANSAAQVDYLLAHPGSVAHDPARIPLAALQAGFGGGATLDSDHDGLSDLAEVQIGSNPYQADTDHDGVSDGVEHRLGSDLLHMDTDNDGIVDSIEYDQGSLAAGLPDPVSE
jgi:hypothetical protein